MCVRELGASRIVPMSGETSGHVTSHHEICLSEIPELLEAITDTPRSHSRAVRYTFLLVAC